VAVFVLPVQQGPNIFDARQDEHDRGPGPPRDKHAFQNSYQYYAENHDELCYLIGLEFGARFIGCASVCYSDACSKSTEALGDWCCCRQSCRL
jgi:hypothetical protein